MTSRFPLETVPCVLRSPAGCASRGRNPDRSRCTTRLRSTTAAIALLAILTGCTSAEWDTSLDAKPITTKTTGKTPFQSDTGGEVDRRPTAKATVEKGSGEVVKTAAGRADFT